MAKHINSKGEIKDCEAEQGNCPLKLSGQPAPHFETVSEAERFLASNYGEFSTLKKKVVIAVDMDNTVVDFNEGFRRHLAKKNGLSYEEALLRYPEPTNYSFHKGETPWFSSVSEFLDNFREAEENGLYENLSYRTGAIRVLRDLLKDERVEVRVVTARSSKFNPETRSNLKKGGFDELPISNFESKEEYEAHIFIDDKDDFAEKIRSGKYLTSDNIVKEVIIPYQHYNAHLNPERDWDDIKVRLDKTIDKMYTRIMENDGRK